MISRSIRIFFALGILFSLAAPKSYAGGIRNYGFMAGTIPIISIGLGVLIASAFQSNENHEEKLNAEALQAAQKIVEHELLNPKAISQYSGESSDFNVQ